MNIPESLSVEQVAKQGSIFVESLREFAVSSLLPFITRIVVAILVLLISKFVIKKLMNAFRKGFEKAKMDPTVKSFLISLIRAALYILVIIGLVEILGVATATIVSVIASAGLAIGLALQGSLSNLAGGLLILILKPFKIGDYISASGVDGSVVSIDIFYTKIRTPDNRDIVIPNGVLSNNTITNVTAQDKRRLDIIASASYNDDIDKVKEVLYEIINESQYTIKDEISKVFISQYAGSSVDYNVRFWVKSEDYWEAKFAVTEEIKKRFDKAGIEIPYSKLDVNILSTPEKDR